MEPAKERAPIFPIYQLMEQWAAHAFGTPEVRAHHHALYYALLNLVKTKAGLTRFALAYAYGMECSGIGSKATYLCALKELEEWGFVKYTPGHNRFVMPIIEVQIIASIGPLLALYRASIATSTSTAIATSTSRNKEVEVLKAEVESLKVEKALYQADATAANAALAEAQKKIAELEAQPLPESHDAQAPQTEGAAADVATSVPLKATKGGKPLLTGELADLLNPGGTAERVQKMKNPFTQAEADALVAKYGAPAACAIVVEMGNYAKLSNNVSANLTAQKWLDKRHPTPGQPLPNPQRNAYGNHTSATSAAARLHTPAPDASAGWGYPGG